MFSLFRVYWVIDSIVRETLLEWHGSFVGLKKKKVDEERLCAFFFLEFIKRKK